MAKPEITILQEEPDLSAEAITVRCLAIVMASFALAGFVVWYGLGWGEPSADFGASIARTTEVQRELFRENNHQLFVALPPAAVASTLAESAATKPAQVIA